MRLRSKIMPLALAFIGTACSGGGAGGLGTSSSGTDISLTAQFIDAPVDGLTWSVVGSESSGKTANQGKFSCNKGQLISFEIGQKGKGLHLGNASCGQKIFIHDLDSAMEDEDNVAKIGAIIQSLDSSDDGVIRIPDAVADMNFVDSTEGEIPKSLDQIVFTGVDDDSAMRGIQEALATKLDLPPAFFPAPVAPSAALTHIQTTINNVVEESVSPELVAFFNQLKNEAGAARSNSNFLGRSSGTEVRVLKRGSGSCSEIDLDFNLGLFRQGDVDSKKFYAYAYATYDTDEVIMGSQTTYCSKLGSNNAEDGECFGYPLGQSLLTSKTFAVRSKFRAVDEYLENLGAGALPQDWLMQAPSIYDIVGALTVENGRLKGRITLKKEDESRQALLALGLDLAQLPESCVYDIDQGLDEDFGDEVGDDEGDDEGYDDGTGSFSGTLACTDSSESPAVPFSFNVNAIISLDPTAPEGYVMNLTVKDDEDYDLYIAPRIELVNDTETPDDIPFLDHNFFVVEDSASAEWTIRGYNDWGNDGYRITQLESFEAGVSCSAGTLLRTP